MSRRKTKTVPGLPKILEPEIFQAVVMTLGFHAAHGENFPWKPAAEGEHDAFFDDAWLPNGKSIRNTTPAEARAIICDLWAGGYEPLFMDRIVEIIGTTLPDVVWLNGHTWREACEGAAALAASMAKPTAAHDAVKAAERAAEMAL